MSGAATRARLRALFCLNRLVAALYRKYRPQTFEEVVGHEARGYTGAGPGPVQWEPANRVRSGRKQR